MGRTRRAGQIHAQPGGPRVHAFGPQGGAQAQPQAVLHGGGDAEGQQQVALQSQQFVALALFGHVLHHAVHRRRGLVPGARRVVEGHLLPGVAVQSAGSLVAVFHQGAGPGFQGVVQFSGHPGAVAGVDAVEEPRERGGLRRRGEPEHVEQVVRPLTAPCLHVAPVAAQMADAFAVFQQVAAAAQGGFRLAAFGHLAAQQQVGVAQLGRALANAAVQSAQGPAGGVGGAGRLQQVPGRVRQPLELHVGNGVQGGQMHTQHAAGNALADTDGVGGEHAAIAGQGGIGLW